MLRNPRTTNSTPQQRFLQNSTKHFGVNLSGGRFMQSIIFSTCKANVPMRRERTNLHNNVHGRLQKLYEFEP